MTTKQDNLVTTADHDAVLNEIEATDKNIGASLLDHLLKTVKFYLAIYNAIASHLLKKAAITDTERNTMTGGTFHGLVTGKKDHPLRYSGKRKYPSQTYLSRAFIFHYLHTDARYTEYRETNTSGDVTVYMQWLQIMYGKSVGKHAELSRNADKIRKSFRLTPATDADRKKGKSYAKAVKKVIVTTPSDVHIPKAVNQLMPVIVKMTDAEMQKLCRDYDMAQWKDEAIVEAIQAGICQLMLNQKAAKEAKAAPKVGASK